MTYKLLFSIALLTLAACINQDKVEQQVQPNIIIALAPKMNCLSEEQAEITAVNKLAEESFCTHNAFSTHTELS